MNNKKKQKVEQEEQAEKCICVDITLLHTED